MPTWAEAYCALIILGTIFNLFSKERFRASYQPLCEILNGVACLTIIGLAFKVIDIQFPVIFSSLCLLYTFGWCGWAYQKDLSRKNFVEYVHNSALEDEQKLKEEQGEDFVPSYNYDEVNLTANIFYFVAIGLVTLLFLPLLYSYWLSIQP